ncbi:MAG: redox-active disulfide protein 2 [uncultured bacterium]|nr:MAG: redox-active disulfide protein 2 [uncultured bacterium]HBR79986.1 redox-active disulfide protein 2 [Candidatus Moranbacteria bacterium]
MEIKILGTGCANCKKLEANVEKALEELSIETVVEKVTELPEIMSYGVLSVPAIVVDEKVLSSGIVLTVKEIKELLKDNDSSNLPSADNSKGCCSCCC